MWNWLGIKRSKSTCIEDYKYTTDTHWHICKTVAHHQPSWSPDKHRTSGRPEGPLVEACLLLPLGGTEVGYKVGLWRVSRGLPSLNLHLAPLTVRVPPNFSTWLVLVFNSLSWCCHCLFQRYRLSLPPSTTKVAIEGRPPLCWPPSL